MSYRSNMSRIRFLYFFVACFLVIFAAHRNIHGQSFAVGSEEINLEMYLLEDPHGQLSMVYDDSFLKKGSRIKLRITANKSAEVILKLRRPDKSEENLTEPFKIEAGTSLLIPDDEGWFVFREKIGKYSFLIVDSENPEKTLHSKTIHVIEPYFSSVRSLSAAANIFTDEIPLFLSNELFENSLAENPLGQANNLIEFKANYSPSNLPVLRGSAANLYKKTAPGVVVVLSDKSAGSGILLDLEGTILTNWHVVGDNQKVAVIFKPPSFQEISVSNQIMADVIKVDKIADLALLKLSRPPPATNAIPLGDFSKVEIAMDVHAIGHPSGEFWTYTRGSVSQIRNSYEWSYETGSKHSAQIIQTQTPINPGNSGGPLLDDEGFLIGINSFGRPDAQGINYAVSVGEIQRFLQMKETRREYPQPEIDLEGMLKDSYDLNDNGIVDAIGLDRDGDGNVDWVFMDENEDGEVDYWLVDLDFNGTFDARVSEIALDSGNIYVWEIDTDGDDVIDVIGYDYDQDGEIDEYQKA